MRKTICYLLLVWGSVYPLNAQEVVVTNYFLPSRMDTRGEVDSLFQVNYSVYEDESAPVYYKNYVFDDNGRVISMMGQEHGSYSAIYVTTHYDGEKAVEETVSLPYSEDGMNTFVYNANGTVKEIRNSESVIRIGYDNQQRILQIDYAYSDGVIFETKKYNYTTSTIYSVAESADGNVYATVEYENGKCTKSIQENGIGGSDVTTYHYNKQGDIEEMKITGGANYELTIKTEYEYDDRGNWIKYTENSSKSGEKPYTSGYTTRKIIYKDGHTTGYDVAY